MSKTKILTYLASFFLLISILGTSLYSQTLNVLVFSKTEGFRHNSIPYGISAIEELGQQHDFGVDASEDASTFTFENLQQYDAIIFLSTTGDVLNRNQQDAFERYIRNGGGFVGIHAASDTEYNWPWYGELVGAYFDSHPAIQTATIEVADRIHPSTTHLPEYWERTDEWYNYNENPRGRVHVLATLDESSYSGGNMGYDHPIAWMHEFDGGRSWYTGGGHTQDSYSEPDFLKHILGGIMYASGNIKGEFDATNDRQYQVTVIDGKPSFPMALAVLPNYDVLYIERGGRMKLWKQSTGLNSIAGEFDVDSGREDGLLGIVLDPDFQTNSYVYVFYSPRSVSEQRVSRFTFDGETLNMDSEIIMLRIPTQRDQCCHSGGDLEFGPNGDLYITTGDNVNPFEADGFAPIDERPGRAYFDAQGTSGNTHDLRGKILRIRPQNDGSYTIPEGNLFTTDEEGLAEIYVMGTRNPFRMAVNKRTGELIWGDVGPDAGGDNEARGPKGYDEFNRTSNAGNFGWPFCIAENLPYREYDFATGKSGPAYNCAEPINNSPNNTGVDTLPPSQPAWIAYTYGFTEKWPQLGEGQRTAIAGDYFYYDSTLVETGSLPEYYDGSLFILEWTRNWVKEIRFNEEGELFQINPFFQSEPLIRPIDMQIGPDGAMYIIEWGTGFFEDNPDDRIIKIEFAQNLANRSPTARVSANVQSGLAPLTIEFRGEDSTDPDTDDVLSYSWDFNGDQVEDAVIANPSYTYTENGEYLATLTVSDPDGASSVAQIQIIVGNSAPNVTITKPLNGGFYEDFDIIDYEVEVTDAEQGTIGDGISCEDIVVEPSIGHDDHAHGTGPRNGCRGSFDAETHGDGPDNVFYVLGATFEDDGAGLGKGLKGSDVVVLNMKRKQAQHANELIDLQTENTSDFLGGGLNIGWSKPNSALKYENMNLTNIDFATIRYASQPYAANIEIRANSINGELLGTIGTQLTGGWQNFDFFTTSLKKTEELLDLYFVFKSNEGTDALGNINFIDFHGKGVASSNQDSLRGLAATYYSNSDFTGEKFIRKDPMIAFNWGNRGVNETIGKNGFSVRWQGEIKVKRSGSYKLYSEPINGNAKIWLNNEQILSGGTSESGIISLSANSTYKLQVEYSHNNGDAGMFLRWSSSIPKNVIPTNSLIPDTEILNISNDIENYIPNDLYLAQNYPNPFNPTTQINFNLPSSGHVRLSVFNMLGQEVERLINEQLGAGFHSLSFNAAGYSSGVYIYRLIYKEHILTKKLLLVK